MQLFTGLFFIFVTYICFCFSLIVKPYCTKFLVNGNSGFVFIPIILQLEFKGLNRFRLD